jgi:TRAP-type transport system periplasmic protein
MVQQKVIFIGRKKVMIKSTLNKTGLTTVLVAIASLGAASAAGATDLRLAHVQAPDDPVHQASVLFAELVEENTGGDITVTISPAGELGDYNQLQEMLQQRAVDIVVESIGTLSPFHPAAGVESMPFLFEGPDHYVEVWNGPIGQEIKDELAEGGNFLVMGHMFRGTRELTANRPIESIDDLQGLRIRVSPMAEREITWREFGASPTPMGWTEVFPSLQRGVIDAQENPLATIQTGSIYEVQDYLILTGHMANGWTFQWNAERFRDLDDDHQDAIIAAADEAASWYNDTIQEMEADLLAQLSEHMTVIEIDSEQFRERTPAIVAEFPEIQDWYNRIREGH